MNIYTLEIGRGEEDTIRTLEHSEPVSARDMAEAINKAKHVISSRSWRPESNVVRLLAGQGADSRPVWTRPMIVARDL